MRCTDYLLPLLSCELVAGKNETNLVVENLGCCAGQRVESVVAQHAEIIAKRHACELHAVDYLHRRKGMDVHPRRHLLHRAQNVAIVEGRKSVGQAALNTNFGGTDFPCLKRFLPYLIRSQKIRIRLPWTAAEGAKFAAHETHIG